MDSDEARGQKFSPGRRLVCSWAEMSTASRTTWWAVSVGTCRTASPSSFDESDSSLLLYYYYYYLAAKNSLFPHLKKPSISLSKQMLS
jgi:hypothetical protein